MARNSAYIGQRVHQGEVLDGVETMWPPLIAEDLFWSVQRILDDPARLTSRPGRANRLLSHLLICASCGAKMRQQPNRNQAPQYVCAWRTCGGIKASTIDQFVEDHVVAWLSDPDVLTALRAIDNSAVAAQARADLDRARVELENWRRLAERGEVDAAGYARATKGLHGRLADAERRIGEASIPPVVRGCLGPDAADRWATASLEVKRQIIQRVAEIRVRPAGSRRHVRIRDRVEWRWLLLPDTSAVASPESNLAVTAREARTLLELGERGSILQSDIAPLVGFASRTQGWQVSRVLLEQGWVTREPAVNPRGGRTTFRLSLTDAGREVVAQLR